MGTSRDLCTDDASARKSVYRRKPTGCNPVATRGHVSSAIGPNETPHTSNPCPLSGGEAVLLSPLPYGAGENGVSVVGAGTRVRNIGHHGAAGGFIGAGAACLHQAAGIQEDLVLQNLLNDDGQLIAALDIDERPGACVQSDHALLNQRRELETPTHLVDDLLFLQFFVHEALL